SPSMPSSVRRCPGKRYWPPAELRSAPCSSFGLRAARSTNDDRAWVLCMGTRDRMRRGDLRVRPAAWCELKRAPRAAYAHVTRCRGGRCDRAGARDRLGGWFRRFARGTNGRRLGGAQPRGEPPRLDRAPRVHALVRAAVRGQREAPALLVGTAADK